MIAYMALCQLMHNQPVIANMLQSPKETIALQMQNAEWQGNESDCGLFALANATSLCNGIDPSNVFYIQTAMRDHCIEQGILSLFPHKPIKQLRIFSICRQPDYGEQMVECTNCKEWLHTQCVRVPYACLRLQNREWLCPACN